MSTETTPAFDPTRLEAVNEQLATATPQEILAWAIDNLPGLYQTTAFGLTGLAAVDMVAKLSKKRAVPHLVPLIFIDTLYHFAQTLKLTAKITKRYKVEISVYKPPGVETVEEFEAKYGEELWKSDEDTYDYLVKVCLFSKILLAATDAFATTGGTRSKGLRRPQRPRHHHWTSTVARIGSCDAATDRNRFDRSRQSQPALSVGILRSEGVHRHVRRAVQRAPRRGVQERRRLAFDEGTGRGRI